MATAAASASDKPASPQQSMRTDSAAAATRNSGSAPIVTLSADAAGNIPPCDLRVGGSSPAAFFAIPLREFALVTLQFNEQSSSSRCVLLLSPTNPYPTEDSAVWRLVSPAAKKTLVLHPADESFRAAVARGALYLAVRYAEESGHALAKLSVQVQPTFYSIWYQRQVRSISNYNAATTSLSGSREEAFSGPVRDCPMTPFLLSTADSLDGSPAETTLALPTTSAAAVAGEPTGCLGKTQASGSAVATSAAAARAASSGSEAAVYSALHIGAWHGRHPHGRGVCFYATAPLTDYTNSSLSAATPQHSYQGAPEAASLASVLLLQTMYERRALPWSALSLPENPTLENTPLDAAFIARITGLVDTHDVDAERSCWQLIHAPIYDEGIEAYDGDWRDGRKHGHGVYQWVDRAYVGDWSDGQREGTGELRCRDGTYYAGEWRQDRRDGFGEALLQPEGNVYRGPWRNGLQDGANGTLTFPDGMVLTGVWEGGQLRAGQDVTVVYADGTRYCGSWQQDQRNGQGCFTDAQGRAHHHVWTEGQRHGAGKVQLRDGICFDGAWEDDRLVSGVYHFPNGDTYTGDWSDERDVRQGHGCCHSANGDVYEGDWADDKRHGVGTMRYAATGAVYTGHWENDEPHGNGRLQDAEGVYEGEMQHGQRCGTGTQTSPDGSTYHGAWSDNHRAGQGTHYDAAHAITYTGIFLCDRLHGEGTMVNSAAGETFSGNWSDGKQQGGGTLRLPSGEVIRGIWHRGEQQDGQVTRTAANGAQYVGEWRGGVRCGLGTEVSADGSTVYEGHWETDKPHGEGRLTKASGASVRCSWRNGEMMDGEGSIEYPDGSRYVGDVSHGLAHGQGTLTYTDGTVFQGTFEQGVYLL